MAGDWIKMRSDLFTHPKVVRMASALKADTLRTVGGLMSAWCLFDAHSEDGRLSGYTPETLDDHLRWPGFAAAMVAVRWLVFDLDEDGGSLALPEFDTHNGQSAKRRAQDADRKKTVRKMSASDADKKRTREEKRREELEASLPPAYAGAQGVEVIDPNTGEILSGAPAGSASPMANLTPAQSGQMVMACKALRKMGAVRFHPGDELLAALMAENFTAEQVVRVAGEKALRDSGVMTDIEVNPEVPELLINGATQQQMGLTDKQHTALRGEISKISTAYIAAALRGRRDEACKPSTGKTHGTATHQVHSGTGQRVSAVERVRAANAAAEERDRGAGHRDVAG